MDRNWFYNYPEGVPKQVDDKHYTSVIQVLEETVAFYKDSPAFTNMGKTLTFEEVDNYATAFAGYLQKKLKIAPHERVAIMMPNCLQYPVALFGALRAGMTVVNINPLYTPREMLYQLKDSGAKVIVILANYAHNLQQILSETNVQTVIITELGDMLGERFLTTKGDKGTGIGLLLAKTAIRRAGGTLRLSNRPGGGARAEVVLPLEPSDPDRTATRHLTKVALTNSRLREDPVAAVQVSKR